MNFMSGFFFEKNITKTIQVLSMICNTICLQFSLCRVWVCFYWFHHVFPILSVILTKYHYTITALCVGKHSDLSTWEGKQPPEGWQIWCFLTQRAVIVLFYFCQCFIGYLSCGGKLGCSVGNNRVVSRQHKFLPMFYRLSPLWGEI